MNTDRCLCLFLKSPQSGTVKTRLAAAVGRDGSAALYNAMVADLLRNIADGSFRTCYYVDGAGALPAAAEEAGADVLFRQQGRTLGRRMTNAFREQFSRGMEKVVLIGSDIPVLDGRLIDRYFQQLDEHNVVIGPAADGGYYLIGMKRDSFAPHLFNRMVWSTSTVYAATVKRIRDRGMSWHAGPVLQDIDTFDDLVQVVGDPGAADKISALLRAASPYITPGRSGSSHTH